MRIWDNDVADARADAACDDNEIRECVGAAFGLLQAPPVTYERTYEMAQQTKVGEKGGWTRRVTVRAAAVGAAVAMLVASGAYAAVSTDFFSNAFGDKGQKSVEAHEVVDEEKRLSGVDPVPWTAPAMEWVAADPAEAERIVGDALTTLNRSVAVGGTTMTLGSCAVDENGLGVATFVLENPDGVAIDDAGYGQFYFDPNGPIADIAVIGEDGTEYDWRYVLDRDLSTETEVHGVLYFGPFGIALGAEKPLGALKFVLSETGTSSVYEGQSVTCDPAHAMGAWEFAAGGVVASVSPVGIVLEGEMVGDSWYDSLKLRFADGSEYVVAADGVMNAVVSWHAGEHTAALAFNRLIDPAAVASVEVVLDQTGETVELLPPVEG